MRTIGFRSNVLFILAAAVGLLAALGRPWYATAPVPTPAGGADRRRARPGRGVLLPARPRVHERRDGAPGWDAFPSTDTILAVLVGVAVVSALGTLIARDRAAVPRGAAARDARDARHRRRQARQHARHHRPRRAPPGRLDRARRDRDHGLVGDDALQRAAAPAARPARSLYELPPSLAVPERSHVFDSPPDPAEPTAARRLVLGAAHAAQPVLEVRRVLDDLREADDGDGVLERDGLAVDLLEEVDELLGAAELGVVVLDVAR